MAKAKNKVVAGDYEGWDVVCSFGKFYFMKRLDRRPLDRVNVSRYEVVDARTGSGFWGSAIRGLAANAVFGGVGAYAAMSSSASKRAILVSVEFFNGERSLIEIDEPTYSKMLKALY